MIDTLILDLDGPILDSQARQYACYKQILEALGHQVIASAAYWQMKRQRRPLEDQLAASGAAAAKDEFRRRWLERIEQPDLLDLDRPQPGALEKLRHWRDNGIRRALVTLRRDPALLQNQLDRLGLTALLDDVLVVSHDRGAAGKAHEVRKLLADLSPARCLWIGDTEIDIQAARAFGCRVCAVSCGIRTAEYLASLAPDFMCEDLASVNLESL